jgi:hypothetical protein
MLFKSTAGTGWRYASAIQQYQRSVWAKATQVHGGRAGVRFPGQVGCASAARHDLWHLVKRLLDSRLTRESDVLTVDRCERTECVEIPALDSRAGDDDLVDDYLGQFRITGPGNILCTRHGSKRHAEREEWKE